MSFMFYPHWDKQNSPLPLTLWKWCSRWDPLNFPLLQASPCLPKAQSGSSPAHSFGISKFRHCKPLGFYLFTSGPRGPAPPWGSGHLSSLGKPSSTCCAMSPPTVRFKNTALVPSASQMRAIPTPQTLHTDQIIPWCWSSLLQSLGQHSVCANTVSVLADASPPWRC